MKKTFSVRHNKYYTSVLVNHVTRDNLLEANKMARELESADPNGKPVVVKPTRRGFDQYRKEYREEELMRTTKVGDSFSIMGVKFTVTDQRPDSYVNGNITLRTKDYLWAHMDGEPILGTYDTEFGIFYCQSLYDYVYSVLCYLDAIEKKHPHVVDINDRMTA